jgi:CheY-like chemotaxis protein
LIGRSAGAADQAALDSRSNLMSFSILIVDDEPDIADLFRQRFRREVRQEQYVLHFAGSGEEALRRLAEIHPELIVILSDINMPGMDGLELLGEIRRVRPELPVLMVTAYGDDDRKRRADELGAAAFLAKPVDLEQLKQHLLRLMPGDRRK